MDITLYDSFNESTQNNPTLNPYEWKIGDFAFSLYWISKKFEGGAAIVYCLINKEVAELQSSGDIIANSNKVLSLGDKALLACKILKRKFADKEELRNQFQVECEKWARMGHHPNIVRAFYIRYIGNIPVLLMEFVPRGSLKDQLPKIKMANEAQLKQILNWSLDFCQGMKFLEEKGMAYHGDIHSGNLLVDTKNRLKISDLGLAFIKDLVPPSKGSAPLQFRAPEVNNNTIDIRSDIFSFGKVMCELLIRAVVFDENKLKVNWPKVPVLASEKLMTLLKTCLQENPAFRYQNIKELENDLIQIAQLLNTEYEPARHELTRSKLQDEAALYFDLGLPEEAMNLLNANNYFNEQEPKNPTQFSLKGRYYYEKEEYEKAIIVYTKYIQQKKNTTSFLYSTTNEDVAQGQYAVGLCYAKMRKIDEALKFIDQAIASDPNFIPSYKTKIACLIDLIIKDEDHPRKEEILNEVINIADFILDHSIESVETRIHKGWAFYYLEKFMKAQKEAMKAVDLDPKFPAGWFLLGETFRRQMNLDDAVKSYERGFGVSVTKEQRHNFLINKASLLITQGQGRLQETQEICETIIAENGDYPHLHKIYGALFIVRDPSKAMKHLLKAYDDLKDDSELNGNIGNASINLGDFKKAEKYYDIALELDKECVVALNGKLSLVLTRWSEHGIELNEVIYVDSKFRELANLAPNNSIIFRNYAIYHQFIGEYEAALEKINIAIKLDPFDQDATYVKRSIERGLIRRRQQILNLKRKKF